MEYRSKIGLEVFIPIAVLLGVTFYLHITNGIPLETVQMMMGHTKITTTQIYADVDEEKIRDDMHGLEEKLNRKRSLIKTENKVFQTA